MTERYIFGRQLAQIVAFIRSWTTWPPVEEELRLTNCYDTSFTNTSLTGKISWKLDIMNVEDWLADEYLLAVMTGKYISQVNCAKEISPHFLRIRNWKMAKNIAHKNLQLIFGYFDQFSSYLNNDACNHLRRQWKRNTTTKSNCKRNHIRNHP